MKIIDNLNSLLGDDLKSRLTRGSKLKIAASCFSLYAYEALKQELSKVESLEFIFTEPTFVPNESTDKLKKERREFFIPKANRERSLYGSEYEIQLRNKLTQRAVARECADWIREKVTFRSNSSKAAMQQFACIHSPDANTAYTPLHGFTAVDLGYQPGDAISNIVNRIDEPEFTDPYFQLFDQIWNDEEKLRDVTSAVYDHIASVYQENSPERVYYLILHNIFSAFLQDVDEDVLPKDRTGYQDTLIWQKLYNYQRDAAVGIINKLETFNGCILADSVGLGKTFTALAVIKYYELRNQAVLVLCPKKLSDNWRTFNSNLRTNVLVGDRFNYSILCHTDLSRTSGESLGIPLSLVNWGNFDLVVIDESHNFRNNDAYKDHETRYQKLMEQVIRSGVRTRVLMLSATPVNNRFSDLRNQLALAYEGDSENLSSKLDEVHNVEEVFRQAQTAFNAWSRLAPQDRTAETILKSLDYEFFELLDSVTIARSRKHIETFYDTSDIGKFPERLKPLSFRCALTNRSDVLGFNEIFAQLAQLNLSIYAPISYVLHSRLPKYESLYDTQVAGGKGKLRQVDRERSLQALMTTNLLKRLESSVQAFRATLSNLQNSHRQTLERIRAFEESGTGSISDYTDLLESLEVEDEYLEKAEEFAVGDKVKIKLSDMDLPSWQHDLEKDLQIINELLESMRKVEPRDDAKLQHLLRLVGQKLEDPINESNQKVLVFTAFADTADYLYQHLADLLNKRGLESAKVTGSAPPKTTLKKSYDFQSVLALFAPVAQQKALALPDDSEEITLLVGTDCISEGQNLQDCDYLINYDIHWNPVRIIQRFGRIDRIGSPNARIQLVNYWPDITLDEYINLKERVENRMMIVDVAGTGDDNPLTAKSNDISYRKEQLRRLQNEVIELEDVNTGVSITDLGLNDFRMDLLKFVNSFGDIETSPKGLHAVIPAQPGRGLHPGVIFALRKLDDAAGHDAHNRLHPFHLIYIDQEGATIANHTEVKKLLDLARTGCRGRGQPVADVCRIFNSETDDGRDMRAYSDLLEQAVHSIAGVQAEKELDSLFSDGKTSALTNDIAGLGDFELVAFLVVKQAP